MIGIFSQRPEIRLYIDFYQYPFYCIYTGIYRPHIHTQMMGRQQFDESLHLYGALYRYVNFSHVGHVISPRKNFEKCPYLQMYRKLNTLKCIIIRCTVFSTTVKQVPKYVSTQLMLIFFLSSSFNFNPMVYRTPSTYPNDDGVNNFMNHCLLLHIIYVYPVKNKCYNTKN